MGYINSTSQFYYHRLPSVHPGVHAAGIHTGLVGQLKPPDAYRHIERFGCLSILV